MGATFECAGGFRVPYGKHCPECGALASEGRRRPRPDPQAVRIRALETEKAELGAQLAAAREALKSIAKNTCRDRCREAALVARAALAGQPAVSSLDATMREALEPFAKVAEHVAREHPGWDHDGFQIAWLGDVLLEMAPFRRARAALATGHQTTGEDGNG